MDYELFHDESQEGGFWHGILLVPISQKDKLKEYFDMIRQNSKYQSKIGIKNVKKHGKVFDCAHSFIQLGLGFLRSDSRGWMYPIFLGKRIGGNSIYEYLPNDCTGFKFILFCERDNHRNLRFYKDYASKVETTFRIGLKGGMHYLGSEESPINIVKMHFDGHEHYRRHLDQDRIVNGLKNLRSYCSIESNCEIDDHSSDHGKDKCQSYIDCQLLQLTDLLVGGFRTYLGICTRDIHFELGKPTCLMLNRYREGYARMQKSRWKNSIWLSRCYIEEGKWQFDSLEYKTQNELQLAMF